MTINHKEHGFIHKWPPILGQWLSSKFAVQVNKWVVDWIKGDVRAFMPPHVKRYILRTYILVAPLDDSGIKFPDKLMRTYQPAECFLNFYGIKALFPDDFPTYEHEFVNQNRPAVYARLYPIKYLEEFRKYFYYTWMPTKSLEYFRQRARKYYRLLSGYCRYRHPKRKPPKK